MIRRLMIVAVAVSLSGCGVNYDVGPDMADLAGKQAIAEAECMKTWAAAQHIDCTGMESRDCMVVRMQAQNIQLVAAATGHNVNPCTGKESLFSVMKEEVVQKNETLRTLGSDAFSAVKWVGGFIAAEKIVDDIGKHAGNVNNVTTDGGDSSISNTSSVTEMNSDATNVGEGTATTGVPDSSAVVPVVTDTTAATVSTSDTITP